MSSTTTSSPLPDYAHPPVVETVLGVQFDRLPGFSNAHLGAFWKALDQVEWPTVSDAPPLPPQFERFTETAQWARGLQFQLTPIPPGRTQIKNRSTDRMIQVQNGRLHFNWLGNRGGDYPRYESVRAGFIDAIERFTNFVEQSDVGDFRPNQWEVTYINQIKQGTIWQTPAEWTFFEPLRGIPTINNLIAGEDFTGEWHFVMPDNAGRLHIEWQHALRTVPDEEPCEVVQLTFTARGPLEQKNVALGSVLNGLDLGRETIVQAFANLMSREANQYWGLKNAND
jgi:uncharacterized protein (TIGR04255 family)